MTSNFDIQKKEMSELFDQNTGRSFRRVIDNPLYGIKYNDRNAEDIPEEVYQSEKLVLLTNVEILPTEIFYRAVHQHMYLEDGSFEVTLRELGSYKILTTLGLPNSDSLLGISLFNTNTRYGQLPDTIGTQDGSILLGMNGYFVSDEYRGFRLSGLLNQFQTENIATMLLEMGKDPSKYSLAVQDHFYRTACASAIGVGICEFEYYDAQWNFE